MQATDQDKLFRNIVRAMKLRRPVTIIYTRANGSVTRRVVEPWMITKNQDGDRYFRAMDRPTADRPTAEPRTFRLDRIVSYTVHGSKSRHRYPVPASKPRSNVPTAAETRRAAELAKADRPTPLTVAHGSWPRPVRVAAVRPLHQAPLWAGAR
jgi:predicted DNA-binding transcriptional regulator YafY